MHPFLLENMARFLVVQDKLEKADVIVVLAGAANGERVREGINLYKEGYAKKILMTGGAMAWRLNWAEWMKKQAQLMGVPASDILIEKHSLSTLENAKFSLAIIKKHGFQSVILVTSPTHARRSKRTINKFFLKENMRLISYPAQDCEFQLPGWWKRHEDTQKVVREYVSLVYYLLKGY